MHYWYWLWCDACGTVMIGEDPVSGRRVLSCYSIVGVPWGCPVPAASPPSFNREGSDRRHMHEATVRVWRDARAHSSLVKRNLCQMQQIYFGRHRALEHPLVAQWHNHKNGDQGQPVGSQATWPTTNSTEIRSDSSKRNKCREQPESLFSRSPLPVNVCLLVNFVLFILPSVPWPYACACLVLDAMNGLPRFVCLVVPHFGLAIYNTICAMSGSRRTWLGTSYHTNGCPPIFFHLNCLVCVGNCPRLRLGIPVATFKLSSLISVRPVTPCAGTSSRLGHNIIFLQPIKTSLMRSFHVRIYSFSGCLCISWICKSGITVRILLTRDQDKIRYQQTNRSGCLYLCATGGLRLLLSVTFYSIDFGLVWIFVVATPHRT